MAIGREPIPLSSCHWTKDQYYQMDEIGWFIDKHVELIAGEIIEEGRMTQQHWVSVNLVGNLLPKKLYRKLAGRLKPQQPKHETCLRRFIQNTLKI